MGSSSLSSSSSSSSSSFIAASPSSASSSSPSSSSPSSSSIFCGFASFFADCFSLNAFISCLYRSLSLAAESLYTFLSSEDRALHLSPKIFMISFGCLPGLFSTASARAFWVKKRYADFARFGCPAIFFFLFFFFGASSSGSSLCSSSYFAFSAAARFLSSAASSSYSFFSSLDSAFHLAPTIVDISPKLLSGFASLTDCRIFAQKMLYALLPLFGAFLSFFRFREDDAAASSGCSSSNFLFSSLYLFLSSFAFSMYGCFSSSVRAFHFRPRSFPISAKLISGFSSFSFERISLMKHV
mmetsp:Transcript_13057/g.25595  ORF Transcript_13057/g.25595 Transcript_13057/m.25595 type:complete len:298 (-) Transcript_13057:1800-2693(-)